MTSSERRPSAGGRSARSLLARAEDLLLAVLLIATVLVVLLQIFFRAVLDQPLSWSNEVAIFLLVWLTFAGLAVATRDRAHIALLLFEERLAPRARRAFQLVRLLFTALLFGALAVGGVALVADLGSTHSPAGVPMWLVYLCFPIGAGLCVLHLGLQIASLRQPGADVGPAGGEPLMGGEDDRAESSELTGIER
jgi:TRAP-type C4-dicarboxylate transport system permease small subunit